MIARWVGIDEAGYGPNLGPLVMSAVMAEGSADRPPDLWGDLASTVARAGGREDSLWVDDSKRVYQGGRGFDRLETAGLALIAAAGQAPPTTLSGLLSALGAGTLADSELSEWLDDQADPVVPRPESRAMVERALALRPLEGAGWRIVSVRTVVVGPSRFNAELAGAGSKADVHFGAFARLLRDVWERAADGVATHVRGDKHGGRHYYLDPLVRTIPDAWIDRGIEGPDLSRYTLRAPERRLELHLQPRADSGDGLVALASIVSKMVREHWMAAFNAHWTKRLPGLRPTAGYPLDAARFRAAIEPECVARGLDLDLWWRSR